MWHDFMYVNLEATLKTPLVPVVDTLWFAFDTYKPEAGESTLPNGKRLIDNRSEFLLRITSESANLYVTKAYNLLGLVFRHCEATTFQTVPSDGEPWQLFQLQNGTELWWAPDYPYIQNLGNLRIRKGNDPLQSLESVQIRNDGIFMRIPWAFLHFSEPATAMVIDDDENVELCKRRFACGMQHLNIKKTDGINVTLIDKNQAAKLTKYKWKDWDENMIEVEYDGVPVEILNPKMFLEVKKASLPIISEGLRNTPFTPKTK
jgi:hypothetical protein